MDDVALLGVVERRQDALEHARHLRERHVADVRAQRSAGDVLHRDVRDLVGLEVVVAP